MAAEKFLKYDGASGRLTETAAVQVGGVGNADKVPALDATGRLDLTMMPTGVGPDTRVIQASEALAAGDYVNIWDSAGAFRVRKADATTAGKSAMGFVLAAVSSGANATVYFEGTNSAVTGQAPGPVFLSTTAGLGASTAPSGSGNVAQMIGYAVSATEVNFDAGLAVVRA